MDISNISIYVHIYILVPVHAEAYVLVLGRVLDMHESCMNMNANMYVSTYICTISMCIYYECIFSSSVSQSIQ